MPKREILNHPEIAAPRLCIQLTTKGIHQSTPFYGASGSYNYLNQTQPSYG